MRIKTKRNLFFIFFIISLILINSCGYEEGPSISLRSAKKRLVRKWKLEQYIKDGNDNTQAWLLLYPDYTIEYRLNNTYEVYVNDTGTYSYGIWTFEENNKIIEREPNSSPGTFNDHVIKKLTTKELWTIYDNSDEFHFVAEKK
jgi:hypothetical protein